MTGQTIATVRWRALDREGEDKCRLAQVEGGWMLVGHARFRDAFGFAALDYVVRCDGAWATLSADIAGRHGDRAVKLTLENASGKWRLNGQEQPQVEGARDIDLSFTPATNLMPLRRMLPEAGLRVRAAWLTYPDCELKPLDQSYCAGSSPEIVTYAARQTDFSTQLVVDGTGFVTLYPGMWEGEVTHAV